MAEERLRRNTELVNAAARENVWAGVGAGSLALSAQIVYRANAGLPLLSEWVGIWTAICALTLFGLLSVIRFSLDEWRDSVERAKMLSLLTDKESEIDRLQSVVAEQRDEIKRLRSRVRGHEFAQAAKDARTVVVAEETDTDQRLRNAERILERWAQGNPYSREAVSMSRPEWESAMSLLRSAGVVGRGGPGGRQWVVIARNHAEALHALRTKGRAWAQTEGTTFVAA